MSVENHDALHMLQARLVADMGASLSGALVVLGDRLGLFQALDECGPMTPAALAAETGCLERYITEWLSAMAAAGYATYHPQSGHFSLSSAQAAAFANEGNPAFFVGAFETVQSVWMAEPRIAERFYLGTGMGWHEHAECLFKGTERFFRSTYNANLINDWLPSLNGVVPKLEQGALVADVGCGRGASTILMAQNFPNSRFLGFDYHLDSIQAARAAAARAGVEDRVTFEVASAKSFWGVDYDLIAMFDCLHDMGDPVGAGRHVAQALAPDGCWLIVEPFADDKLEKNLNAIGRIFYAASTMICTPASLSQEVGLALGAQAGEARLREVVKAAGFGHFHRAAESAFNMVFEARK